MKKILLYLSIVLLSGCSFTQTSFKRSVYVNDLRKYTEQGFIITPTSTGFSYKPIAELSIEVIVGAKKNTMIERTGMFYDEATGDLISKSEYINKYGADAFEKEYGNPIPKEYKYSDVVDDLVNQAKKMGANALLNFSSEAYYDTSLASMVYRAKGFAVVVDIK